MPRGKSPMIKIGQEFGSLRVIGSGRRKHNLVWNCLCLRARHEGERAIRTLEASQLNDGSAVCCIACNKADRLAKIESTVPAETPVAEPVKVCTPFCRRVNRSWEAHQPDCAVLGIFG